MVRFGICVSALKSASTMSAIAINSHSLSCVDTRHFGKVASIERTESGVLHASACVQYTFIRRCLHVAAVSGCLLSQLYSLVAKARTCICIRVWMIVCGFYCCCILYMLQPVHSNAQMLLLCSVCYYIFINICGQWCGHFN